MTARTFQATATHDPLRVFQFRVKFADASSYLAGVRGVSGLSVNIGAFEIWEGGNNLHRYAQPDKVTWDPITLEHGIALGDALEGWANAVVDFSRLGRQQQQVKRNLQIEVWDPFTQRPSPEGRLTASTTQGGGARVRVYTVYNAWISKYQALPKLDATLSEVAIETVEIMHEGWRRAPASGAASASAAPES